MEAVRQIYSGSVGGSTNSNVDLVADPDKDGGGCNLNLMGVIFVINYVSIGGMQALGYGGDLKRSL